MFQLGSCEYVDFLSNKYFAMILEEVLSQMVVLYIACMLYDSKGGAVCKFGFSSLYRSLASRTSTDLLVRPVCLLDILLEDGFGTRG